MANKYTRYPLELIEWLKSNSWNKTVMQLIPVIAEKFNIEVTYDGLRSLLKRNHITRFKAGYGRFEKNHTPYNKGLPMPAETRKKISQTWFQKGHTVWNHRQVGAERISKDGYSYIKVAEPNRWQLKHRVIYENYHNVKLNKDDVVIFLDGNKKNFDIDNLALVTRGDNGIMNHCKLRYADKKLTETGIITARLKALIRRKEKELKWNR